MTARRLPEPRTVAPRPGLLTAAGRGVRGRCPTCGAGRLFRRRLELHDRCPACRRRTLRDAGDPWAFFVVADRLFVLLLIVVLYFQLAPEGLPALLALFAVLFMVFVATTRQRLGLCVGIVQALDREAEEGAGEV